jgi:hypothetical protein
MRGKRVQLHTPGSFPDIALFDELLDAEPADQRRLQALAGPQVLGVVAGGTASGGGQDDDHGQRKQPVFGALDLL